MRKNNKNTKTRMYESKDAYRLNSDIPLIVDTTELITPEKAQNYLKKNKSNRPINWNKVAEYQKMMENGTWKLHSQGIVFDEKGYLLTGQKRLLAIIYVGIPQYMRVSRGTPSDVSHLLDRGTPQSARDLATRKTDRKHSPIEVSIIRAICAIDGTLKPSIDDIAEMIVIYSEIFEDAIKQMKGIKKTKLIIMIIGAICYLLNNSQCSRHIFANVKELADQLEIDLLPTKIEQCWNKGAAFTFAMEKAILICEKKIEKDN